jgi:hypothetical protein
MDGIVWNADWAGNLPLIAVNMVTHVFCLGLFTAQLEHLLNDRRDGRHFMSTFALVMSIAVTLATLLHGIEGALWAGAHRALGALPDNKSAILNSLSALTSYGHANLYLDSQWQMMGALEALSGMLLFG